MRVTVTGKCPKCGKMIEIDTGVEAEYIQRNSEFEEQSRQGRKTGKFKSSPAVRKAIKKIAKIQEKEKKLSKSQQRRLAVQREKKGVDFLTALDRINE